MFIREAVKNVRGKKYVQHHLVESVRTPAGPRQRLVLNLGQISMPRDKWKELADTIESELHNQSRLFVTDPETEKSARYYAKKIIRKKLSGEAGSSEQDSPEFESADIDSVSVSDAGSMGAEHVALSQMREYGFDKMLKEHGFDEKQTDYAKMLIVGRLIHPSGERETVRRINENSAVCELSGTDAGIYDNALRRTAICLWEKHEKTEQRLAEAAKRIFSLKETVILYDLTNTYFEGSRKDSDMAKPGRSEERRNSPLITLALIADEDGFPENSKILEGSVSEPGTLEKAPDELSVLTDGFNAWKTIVIDAGIATEDNLKIIKSRQYRYIAVSGKKSYEEGLWEEGRGREIRLSDGKTKLMIKLAKTDGEAYLLCHSEAKEAKETKMLAKRFEKFENALRKMKEGLKKKRTQKNYEKIIERIGRLREKYGVGSLYDIEVREEDGLATEIIFSKNPNGKARERRVGDYVLRTDRPDLTDEEISKIHRSLTTIEDSFRYMKSDPGMRPIYHKRDDMCKAHIFVTVLAYHIIIGILKKLKTKGVHHRRNTIRNIFSNHIRVTTAFNAENGDTIHVRTSTTPTSEQQSIYDKLNIDNRPLNRVRTRIPLKKKQKRDADLKM